MAWKVHIRPGQPWSLDVELYLAHDSNPPRSDTREVVTHFATIPVKEGVSVSPVNAPDGQSMHEFLQAIVTAAWEIGIRPLGYNDIRESMTATKAHLEDMRTLVFRRREGCSGKEE